LQFHCGKPPPAEEPNTMIFMIWPDWLRAALKLGMALETASSAAQGKFFQSAIGNVHRNFKAKTQIGKCRLVPFHDDLQVL
jgi:hypothetical protein